MIERLFVTAACLFLGGCSVNPAGQARSLLDPVPLEQFQPAKDVASAAFLGLERAGLSDDGTIAANIFMVHGIGWTQKIAKDDSAEALPTKQAQFGFDLIKAFARHYDVDTAAIDLREENLCAHAVHEQRDGYSVVLAGKAAGGLKIMAKPSAGEGKAGRQIGCLDRIELALKGKGRVRIYRMFWDDAFYNGFEYRHLGYDDGYFSGDELLNDKPIFEDIEADRLADNRAYKRDLVTYGLTDAAMYIGPVGAMMREAVRSALCEALDDAMRSERTSWNAGASAAAGCTRAAQAPSAIPLSIIAESLGSRVVFDVLTGQGEQRAGAGASQSAASDTEALAEKIARTRGKDLEVYLMANQIPLIGTGMGTLFVVPTKRAIASKTLRFVAFSERNDLLTYELVPYFEHLYFLQCGNVSTTTTCYDGMQARYLAFKNNKDLRRTYVESLGFEVVDVRLRFAPLAHVLVRGLADPLKAHTGHLQEPMVQELVLCGVREGLIHEEGCMAKRR